jgi:hypothetical protein
MTFTENYLGAPRFAGLILYTCGTVHKCPLRISGARVGIRIGLHWFRSPR